MRQTETHHELSVSFRQRVGDEADGLQMIHNSMKKLRLQDRITAGVTRGKTLQTLHLKTVRYLFLRLRGEVRMGQQYINITTRLGS